MAEGIAVLGALSSAFQILDFSTKLANHARVLVKAGHVALEENVETEKLARMYKGLAESVAYRRGPSKTLPNSMPAPVGDIDQVWIVSKDLINEADQLIQELEGLKVTATSKLARLKEGTVQAARYLKKKSSIEKRRKTLAELNGLLSTALLRVSAVEQRTLSLLETLHFEGMQFREDSILDAYPKTYAWALDDDAFGLRSWLERGDGLFWVTGKAGSGKSTLMKLLCSSPETSRLLRSWASGAELIIARFYFWYLGSSIQKSIEGLLRSLLYQIIQQYPERASFACPEWFTPTRPRDDTIRLSSGQTLIGPQHDIYLQTMHWTQSQLMAGLQRVASAVHHRHTTKFCFFIDGLDEYSGIHGELIQLLRSLSHETGIKMCVSSRPWAVFTRAFDGSKTPQLLLEVLTKEDIRYYVDGHIRKALDISPASGANETTTSSEMQANNEIAADIISLIDDIVQRAEGVFLWVYLVVRSVLRGLDEGDTVKMLQQRVVTFPPDLEAFFKTLIFDRVDTIYASQTCQALTLAFKCAQNSDSMLSIDSFLHYWMISSDFEGFDNVETVFKSPITSLSQKEMNDMAVRTRSFLSASCRDLLLLERKDDYHPSTKVVFLHRTVYDFLCTDPMQEILRSHCPDIFQSDMVFHLLNLAKTKYLRHDDAQMAECLIEWANYSLAADNVSQDYVKQFADAISSHDECATYQQYPISVSGKLSPLAISTMLAFGQTDIGQTPFKTEATFREWVRAQNTDLSPLCLSVLGESHRNRFSLASVNVGLVSEFARYSQIFPGELDSSPWKASDRSLCNASIWQMFLRKLALEFKELMDGESDERKESLAQACIVGWEIAKLFMACGAPGTQVFCVGHTPTGAHDWHTANGLLDECVPEEWLSIWRSTEVDALRVTYLHARARRSAPSMDLCHRDGPLNALKQNPYARP